MEREKEIARLLNFSSGDKSKLRQLLDDYLQSDSSDIGSDTDDSTDDPDTFDGEIDHGDLNQFDMTTTQYEVTMKNMTASNDVLFGDYDVDLDKATKFQ